MPFRLVTLTLALAAILFGATRSSAQPLGTFRWQLTPYCNVITAQVTQVPTAVGIEYRLEGFDDQCGITGRRAPLNGMAVPNPSGMISFGIAIVTPNGPVHVDVDFNYASLGGFWRDSSGNTGTLIFFPGGTAGGPARPAPVTQILDGSITTAKLASGAVDATRLAEGAVTASKLSPGAVDGSKILDGSVGAADINGAEVQRRIIGACGAMQYVQTVNADGTVICGSDGVGLGDITAVIPGVGLTGGAASGDATLSVAFDGTGTAPTAAHSDHTHASAAGDDNIGLGDGTLENNTTGANNTGVGNGALNANTDGGGNTALGYRALLLTTSGSFNTSIGLQALDSLEAGSRNTAVGANALGFVQNGASNVGVGDGAGLNLLNGSGNVAIGADALFGATVGSGNIALGSTAGYAVGTGSNNIHIGNVGVDESGTIRIGTTSTHTRAFIAGINGATAASGVAVFVDANGQLGTLTSSARFKEEIASVGDVRAQVQALRPVTFYYKPAFDDGGHVKQYGLIAEEVEKVMPDMVVRDAKGEIQTVRYQFLTPLLLAEVQRLEQERTTQAEQLKGQAERLDAQARQIAELRAMIQALMTNR